MKLPQPIQAYFDADTDTDGPAPTAAFAPDAIVKDEGKTLVGREAIAEWWRAAKARTRQFQSRAKSPALASASSFAPR